MIQKHFFARHCRLGQRTDSDFLKHTMFGFNRMRNSMAQYAERILNKTAKAINETFARLKLMLQGFRIYFV